MSADLKKEVEKKRQRLEELRKRKGDKDRVVAAKEVICEVSLRLNDCACNGFTPNYHGLLKNVVCPDPAVERFLSLSKL